MVAINLTYIKVNTVLAEYSLVPLIMTQSRRRRENDTFTDMADVLPIQENAKDLDKASILRVAINYMLVYVYLAI